jgi:NTP pyrophosphatase (non-canonical NTP hydrolase)
MKYKLYHIPGKKIGVTLDPKHRVETQQGYGPGEYEILEESNDIDYISHREIELQRSHGYRVDETLYKQLNPNKDHMRINITEQTTTFPVPLNKLKGRLMDNIGMVIQTGFNRHELDTDLVDWIMKHAVTSQFNEDRCYVYNKAMSNFRSATLDNTHHNGATYIAADMFTKIRRWAYERGIYDHGDSKTQYVKLMEEAGELAEALLKNDKPEIIDAIGDMVVVLTNLAKLEKLDIEDCIENAYETISKRTGKMMNGTFVKNTL